MESVANAAVDEQKRLNSYFAEHTSYWAEIYEGDGVQACIHQQRLCTTLGWVTRIARAREARALEIGCGTGACSIALAKRAYFVVALDPVQSMLKQTRDRAIAAGQEYRVRTSLGDVRSIPFPNDTFDVVIALGVLPWLHSIEEPLREIVRVLRPGGHLIITQDNSWSLLRLADPLRNPLLNPAKKLVRRLLRRFGDVSASVRPHPMSLRKFDAMLRTAKLEKVESITLGFGPFRFLDSELMSPSAALKLHLQLQGMANRGFPILRSSGAQYIVLARRCGSVPDHVN
jgi:ubiquinone/menaquinone biosynthesis C-methylase UbiE